MSIELMQTLSLVMYILSGLMLLLTISLIFLLNIPKVVGDITGSTARKAIEDIRHRNTASGDKTYKPSSVNMARGKITDKISPSGRLQKYASGINVSVTPERIKTAKLAAQSDETTVLEEQSGETAVLEEQSGETTVLAPESESANETTVLAEPNKPVPPPSLYPHSNAGFILEFEMGFLGSEEIIE